MELKIGSLFTDAQRPQIQDAHLGVKFDYVFMARRQKQGSDQVQMKIWVFLMDHESFKYQHFGSHIGHFENWKELIKLRIQHCMLSYGVDKLMATRMLREFEASKDKMIKWDDLQKNIMTHKTY